VKLTHVGGPTTLIEIDGRRLLTDPTFDPPGRRYSFGWGASSRKLAGPAVPAEEIGAIDAVLLTHDHHGDNLDDAGRALLPSAGAVLTTGSGARRLGGGARGLRDWETTTLDGLEITATPCRHGPPGLRFVFGDVIGFHIAWDGGSLWISGDTVLYGDVRAAAERLDVDTLLLHLGCVRFPVTGPLHYTLSAREAVELCGLAGARTVVPVHYEGWKHFREGRADFERELEKAPEVKERVRWIPIGAGVTLA
jgi:L-ascorbate metabolism protein UlaG (beta-lactamase superfamily)